MSRALLVAVMSFFLACCAQKAADIGSMSVSPLLYDNYNCNQLVQEAQRVSARANQVAGVQDQKATNDAIATGVAVVLFWPAAFFIGGDKGNAQELARLRGELEAIEQTMIRKKCGISFQKQS